MYIGKDLETLRRQLYSRDVSYKKFAELTDKDVKRIQEKVKSRQRNSQYPRTYFENIGFKNYYNTLLYLTGPSVHKELKSFDERMLYMVLSVDPNLETYNTYLETEIIPIADIAEASTEEQPSLLAKRKEAYEEFGINVRKKLGFFDSNLNAYESVLAERLLKTETFVSDVKPHSIGTILRKAELVTDINNVTSLGLERLKSGVEKWYIEAKNPEDINTLAYNLTSRYKEFNIRTLQEQILMFILIADPKLDLLRIYEEESRIDKMQERAKSELGFYSKGLVNVEQLYHDKFEPELKVSAWTK